MWRFDDELLNLAGLGGTERLIGLVIMGAEQFYWHQHDLRLGLPDLTLNVELSVVI